MYGTPHSLKKVLSALSMYCNKLLLGSISIGLIIQIGLLVVHYTGAPLPYALLDAVKYQEQAVDFAQHYFETGTLPYVVATGSTLYIALIGSLYIIFGVAEFIPVILNLLLWIGLIVVVYALTSELTRNTTAPYLAAFGTALFPPILLYSVILQRDSLVLFFTALSVYALVRWMNKPTGWLMAISLGSLAVVGLFHFGVVIIGAVHVAVFLFYESSRERWVLFDSGHLLREVVVKVVLVTVFAVLAVSLFSTKLSSEPLPALLSRHLDGVAWSGRAVYLEELRPASLIDVGLQTPVRMAYFLFAPYPWEIQQPLDLLGVGVSVAYAALLVLAVWATLRRKGSERTRGLVLLAMVVLFVAVFAWGTSNYGTSFRHKSKIVWVLISLASVGIAGSPWFQHLHHAVVRGWGRCAGIMRRPRS
ncbi:MAG: hypothetical protein WD049_04140 [Candidatus Paceibacterota bacterium]